MEAVVEPTLRRLGADESTSPGIERARQAFEGVMQAIVDQPAAAKMCVVEVYAAGEAGAALVDRTMERATDVAAALLEQVAEREVQPRELVRALIEGIKKVIHNTL